MDDEVRLRTGLEPALLLLRDAKQESCELRTIRSEFVRSERLGPDDRTPAIPRKEQRPCALAAAGRPERGGVVTIVELGRIAAVTEPVYLDLRINTLASSLSRNLRRGSSGSLRERSPPRITPPPGDCGAGHRSEARHSP